ncbi:MAG TPA: DegV family protein [Dehalococcoidia bacterium]|nr:DegV family protein [Dehalococcoidia bacterium]
MTVRIVTDSTSDIPAALAHELGISVVPLSVIFGDEVYREGHEITHDLFYEKLVRSKVMPTTSAPSVGDFLAVYEPLLKETDEIVSIHISSKLSATYNNACQAAKQLSDQGARIEVMDSLSVSFGLSFLAQAAARAAGAGASVEEIRKIVDGMIPRLRILVVLDTLEYVRRGGRIGRARAFLGAMLKVKPILSFRDGEVHPEERVRTKALALERLLQIATSYRIKEVGIGYSTNAQDAEDLKRRLAVMVPGVDISIVRLGPVLGVHGGPGTLGIGVLEGED